MLSESDTAFLAARRRFVRTWPVAGWSVLAVLVALAGWLLATRPLLISPWAAMARLEAGTLPPSTLALAAVMLPVAMLMCLLVTAAAVLFGFAAFANERRHLAIIDQLGGATPPERG